MKREGHFNILLPGGSSIEVSILDSEPEESSYTRILPKLFEDTSLLGRRKRKEETTLREKARMPRWKHMRFCTPGYYG
jgi:hypothetical protein